MSSHYSLDRQQLELRFVEWFHTFTPFRGLLLPSGVYLKQQGSGSSAHHFLWIQSAHFNPNLSLQPVNTFPWVQSQ
jgi:hypothetical protein